MCWYESLINGKWKQKLTAFLIYHTVFSLLCGQSADWAIIGELFNITLPGTCPCTAGHTAWRPGYPLWHHTSGSILRVKGERWSSQWVQQRPDDFGNRKNYEFWLYIITNCIVFNETAYKMLIVLNILGQYKCGALANYLHRMIWLIIKSPWMTQLWFAFLYFCFHI